VTSKLIALLTIKKTPKKLLRAHDAKEGVFLNKNVDLAFQIQEAQSLHQAVPHDIILKFNKLFI
jgi:hypothetical protein